MATAQGGCERGRARPGDTVRCVCDRPQPKDPSAYSSIDELRAELEASEPGLFSGLVAWLSTAAQSTAAGTDWLKALYRRALEARQSLLPKSTASWDEELAALDRLEVSQPPSLAAWCGGFLARAHKVVESQRAPFCSPNQAFCTQRVPVCRLVEFGPGRMWPQHAQQALLLLLLFWPPL